MTDRRYRLKLFGGLGLERPEELGGRVVQRRQLALLALLTVHEGPLSRDKLIGFLWPETRAERARHQLSDALYVIRKELGEEAVLTAGETLRTDPAVVGSDLADFRAALANDAHEDALACYAGPFLDGFFPDGSEPYERWMLAERESLEREARRAAWTLADGAEEAGEVHEAIRWTRRALAIAPEDERAVRRLIRLQGAVGNRAGAVRTYHEFAGRLEAELDVRPSEETQALIAAVREGDCESVETTVEPRHETVPTLDSAREEGAPPVPPRRRSRRALLGGAALAVALLGGWLLTPGSEGGPSPHIASLPASVAVLPFEVRGEGLEVWREGMVDVISRNLDLFSDVRAVPSRTVLAGWRAAEIDDPGRLDRHLRVARGVEARYAVTGSVVGTERGIRILARIVDVRTGDPIGEAVAEGAPDSIFALVDRVSMALVGPLAGSRSEVGRLPRLASVTTSSPDALEAFLEGEALYRSGRYQAAIEALQRAIAADSTFALAHYRIAEAYLWTTSGADSGEHSRIAARYADRLPEREARLLRALNLGGQGRWSEWIATIREAVRRHPDDPQAWHWLGEVYYHVGHPMLVRPWEFIDAFERSIELDPSFVPAYEHLIHAAFQRAPDSTRARALIERRLALGPEEDREHFEAEYRLAFADSLDLADVRELLRGFSAYDIRSIAVHSLAHPSLLDRRENALRVALEGSAPNWEGVIKKFLFWTLVGRGRLAAALDVASDPLLDRDRPTLLYEAHAYGYPIPRQALLRALADTSARPDPGSSTDFDWTTDVPWIFERAAYAAERGDWDAHARAKRELQALIPTLEPEYATDTLRLRGLVAALEGFAAWRRGDRARAIAVLREAEVRAVGGRDLDRSITSERNQILRAWLGRLLLEMDRPREALVYYESLGPGWPFGQDPMMYFHMGQVRDRLGDREGAREAYELAALAWRDPDPAMEPFATIARREAARLRASLRE